MRFSSRENQNVTAWRWQKSLRSAETSSVSWLPEPFHSLCASRGKAAGSLRSDAARPRGRRVPVRSPHTRTAAGGDEAESSAAHSPGVSSGERWLWDTVLLAGRETRLRTDFWGGKWAFHCLRGLQTLRGRWAGELLCPWIRVLGHGSFPGRGLHEPGWKSKERALGVKHRLCCSRAVRRLEEARREVPA